MLRNLSILFLVALSLIPAAWAQTAKPPASYTECDELYAKEFKKAAGVTGKDLRESQRIAGLQRMRCDRAVERKMIMDRAKGANRPGAR